jgi:RNA polymerase sigma-70 factor (ECF subfamily)
MTALAPTPNGEAMTDAIPARTDDGLSAFVAARPRLLGIAHRMLGSTFDAEDIVQDVWLRWQATDRSVVRSVPAFLATTTIRLAINVVQSAHSRHEIPSEPWLPEPGDAKGDPGLEAERGEALERAVRLLLEKLSPTERAAYVLNEAFDYPYARIAGMLRVSHANARQIASRARRHLAAEGRRGGSSGEQRRLLDVFLLAAQTGELAALEKLLNADVASTSERRKAA